MDPFKRPMRGRNARNSFNNSANSNSNDNSGAKKAQMQQNGAKAQAHIDKRLKQKSIYNVKYEIVEPMRFEDLASAKDRKSAEYYVDNQLKQLPDETRKTLEKNKDELIRRALWMRPYDYLSKKEREFMENKADVISHGNDPVTMGPIPINVNSPQFWSRQVYQILSQMRRGSPGFIDMMISPVRQQDAQYGQFADQQGRKRYTDKPGGLVVLHTGRGEPTTVLRKSMGLNVGYLKDHGISREEFEALVLEHELAHLSGAGEPQADSMATAQYIRHFGKDDMPKFWADFRALHAMQTMIAMHIGAKVVNKLEDLGEQGHADMIQQYMDQRLEGFSMYSWACVDSMDAQIAKGVAHNQALDDDEIRELRFKSWNHDLSPLKHLIEAYEEHEGLKKGVFDASDFNVMKNIAGIQMLAQDQDLKKFAKFARSLTSDQDARMAKIPAQHRKAVIRIAQRFADAADRTLVNSIGGPVMKPVKGPKPVHAKRPRRRLMSPGMGL